LQGFLPQSSSSSKSCPRIQNHLQVLSKVEGWKGSSIPKKSRCPKSHFNQLLRWGQSAKYNFYSIHIAMPKYKYSLVSKSIA
jgi:hypothetical protein